MNPGIPARLHPTGTTHKRIPWRFINKPYSQTWTFCEKTREKQEDNETVLTPYLYGKSRGASFDPMGTMYEIYQECIYAPTDFDKLVQEPEPEEYEKKADGSVDGGASEVMDKSDEHMGMDCSLSQDEINHLFESVDKESYLGRRVTRSELLEVFPGKWVGLADTHDGGELTGTLLYVCEDEKEKTKLLKENVDNGDEVLWIYVTEEVM